VAETSTALALDWLRRASIRIVVATPAAERPHWESDLGEAVAIVVGGERYGVSRAWLDAADEAVGIPMPGAADSLNVAVAAGILLFDAGRRRAAPDRAAQLETVSRARTVIAPRRAPKSGRTSQR
jgi:tRNA G18 (ribose-2'-O)-methylase SpoU